MQEVDLKLERLSEDNILGLNYMAHWILLAKETRWRERSEFLDLHLLQGRLGHDD